MSVNKYFFSIKSINNKKIKHGFFTRVGGYSKKQFMSLNCGISNNDNKNLVFKNRNLALKKLKLDHKKLILVKQTHSSKIVRITKKNQNKNIEADWIITSLNNIAIVIITADCAPIFIINENKNIICCLHSGWKGTLKNISRNAIKNLENYNINRNTLVLRLCVVVFKVAPLMQLNYLKVIFA